MAGAPGVNPEPDLVCDRSIYSYMYIYTSCPSLSYMESILNLILCVTGQQLYIVLLHVYIQFSIPVVPGVNHKPDHVCDGSIDPYMYIYTSSQGLAYLE